MSDMEYMDIGIVKEELAQALDAYPFTHMGVNPDGMMILKRWLYLNTGQRIEISYIVAQGNGLVSLDSLQVHEGVKVWAVDRHLSHDVTADEIPDDIELLELARLMVMFDYSRM